MEQLGFLTDTSLKSQTKSHFQEHELCRFPSVNFINCLSEIWCKGSDLRIKAKVIKGTMTSL